MKTTITFFSALLALALLYTGCIDDNKKKCNWQETITAQAACYDPNKGLTLTASGNEDDTLGYRWDIWVLKDTTNGTTPNDPKLVVYQLGTVTLTDAFLLDNKQVLARISNNCDGQILYSNTGKELYSKFYSFFRRTSGSCVTWQAHEF